LLVWLVFLARLATSRSQPKARVMVPLVLTAFASLDAARHIPIFVLAALPMLAATEIGAALSAPVLNARRPSLAFLRLRPVFNSAVVILMALFMLMKWAAVVRTQAATEAELYPGGAVAWLRRDQSRRVFAHYDWGGYLLWKLYPNQRLFVDGRADLYGDDLLRQFKIAIQLQNGWRDVLDGWKVDTVLVPPNGALAQALLIDPGWRAVFSDAKSAIFERQSASTRVFRATTASLGRRFRPVGKKSEKISPRLVANLRNYEPM
jgi:hypothetical protein